jgi:hypothetical protein
MQSHNGKTVEVRAPEGFRALLLGQGAFYFATGLWPLLNLQSFEKITGPKTDRWLVKTAGVLIAVIGGTMTVAGLRQSGGPEIPVLAIGSAVGLTAIDLNYAAKRRISAVYLLDAVAEATLVGCWAFTLLRNARKRKPEA